MRTRTQPLSEYQHGGGGSLDNPVLVRRKGMKAQQDVVWEICQLRQSLHRDTAAGVCLLLALSRC
jgi:hypothetical protein